MVILHEIKNPLGRGRRALRSLIGWPEPSAAFDHFTALRMTTVENAV
jgi:hypothetical protein